MNAKLTIKRKQSQSSSSSASASASQSSQSSTINSSTSCIQNSQNDEADDDDIVEVAPSLSGSSTLHFPIRTMVSIHRNVVLQITLFDKLRDKSTLKSSLASTWFKKEHLDEFYTYLKYFLKKQIYQEIKFIPTEPGRIELKIELPPEKTIQVIKCKTIQFTYEWKKTYSNFFMLRRKDTQEEYERELLKAQLTRKPSVPILIEDDPQGPVKHNLDLSDEETPNKKQKSIHNLDLSDEENVKQTPPRKKKKPTVIIEDDDSSSSEEEDVELKEDIELNSPPFKKFKQSLVSWRYQLLVYLEPKEKDILELTGAKSKSKFF
ncbi:predicted protein [Naegleria gruberi]|uniref:Predicted protein n=1 Tax=Naegleria gruberi TaxID=5762 RepID=D2VDU0_NAEGR|nr:uncharacterized protein NAEGRDRAFT_67039 [Naegleria gruberi]EFC44959.1 predicted protein [Naegleria gruberi]|eukprot:XP_002677703.1 predicted protein [Naegleria gruberi strain NEG-M]